MDKEMDKSLDELREAIDEDQNDEEDLELDNELDEDEGKSQDDEGASDEEGTLEGASDNDSDEGTPDEDWIIPGRIKTQEDLLKSYRELETFTGSQSSEIQKLRSAVTAPPRKGESPEDRNERLVRFAEEIKKDPVEAIKNIVRSETDKDRNVAQSEKFAGVYEQRMQDPEFAELEPVMTQIATHYGDMIQANGMNNDPRLLDILHYAAKGVKATEIAKKAADEAKQKGIIKGQKLQRKKAKAKIEGSSGNQESKKSDVDKLTASEIKAKLKSGELEY